VLMSLLVTAAISSNRFKKHVCVASIAPLAFYRDPDYRVANS
jgi:hypothetical protein